MTLFAQQKGGAVISSADFPLGVRIGNAVVSYLNYIRKTIWPGGLAVFYPHPESWSVWQTIGAVFFLSSISLALIRGRKRFPYLAVGWLWFTVTLLPVIGFVQVGYQAMADRYTYIPLVGLFIMAAWLIPDLTKKWACCEQALFALAALILVPLFAATWIQTGYWRNSIILYNRTLEVTGSNAFILYNRGLTYSVLGDYRRAVSDLDSVIGMGRLQTDAYYKPGSIYSTLCAQAYYKRGIAYGKLGDYTKAIQDYDKVIEIGFRDAQVYNSRGVAYDRLGNLTHAIENYNTAVGIDPDSAMVFNNRGNAYRKLGNHARAIEDYNRAIALDPEYELAYYNRAVAYTDIGQNSMATDDLKKAAQLGCEEAGNILKSRGIIW
ncbi:MAG TPA: tetratricopeptide repeat protein [Syntrophobacteraceae bacterium]|nr:tetratricopeptide repeat protein [Syntrophobacteraceae bacterium]